MMGNTYPHYWGQQVQMYATPFRVALIRICPALDLSMAKAFKNSTVRPRRPHLSAERGEELLDLHDDATQTPDESHNLDR